MLAPVMWVFPLVAAVVAFAFAASLARQYRRRRRPYQLVWTIALAMYGVASLAVAAGAAGGWSRTEFQVYWGLGAVLNVPFLAAGELLLLFRRSSVLWATSLVLVFVTAYTVTVLRTAAMDSSALTADLPSGKDVFGDGTAAHRLPQLVSIPSYVVLVVAAAWSAWTMRGHRDLHDRFVGTLLIAAGATVIAGLGSAFAALGELEAFSVALLAGVAAMFWGFLRASRSPATRPATVIEPTKEHRRSG
jgi:hypothetical protein